MTDLSIFYSNEQSAHAGNYGKINDDHNFSHIRSCLFDHEKVLKSSEVLLDEHGQICGELDCQEIQDFLVAAPIATTTNIYVLSAKININMLYPLLRTTYVTDPRPNRKNVKVPLVEDVGAILSVRHSNKYRGFMPRPIKNAFRNCITIDLSIGNKNINMKLSPNTIHQTGANSLENGLLAVNCLFKHIRDIYEMIEYMSNNYDQLVEIVDWCNVVCKGDFINMVCHKLLKPAIVPAHFDAKIVKYIFAYIERFHESDIHIAHRLESDMMVSKTEDVDKKKKAKVFIEYSIFESFKYLLDHLLTSATNFNNPNSEFVEPIIIEKSNNKITLHPNYLIENLDEPMPMDNIKIMSARTVMVNQKFFLKIKIKRKTLANRFMNREGIFVHYNNDVDNSVSIQMPYGPKMVGDKKISAITFSIARTGAVTVSGPNIMVNYLAYCMFMPIMVEILPDIVIDDRE